MSKASSQNTHAPSIASPGPLWRRAGPCRPTAGRCPGHRTRDRNRNSYSYGYRASNWGSYRQLQQHPTSAPSTSIFSSVKVRPRCPSKSITSGREWNCFTLSVWLTFLVSGKEAKSTVKEEFPRPLSCTVTHITRTNINFQQYAGSQYFTYSAGHSLSTMSTYAVIHHTFITPLNHVSSHHITSRLLTSRLITSPHQLWKCVRADWASLSGFRKAS